MMKRKRLFERLYSAKLRTLVCRDCGQDLETGESPSSCFCPNCGGRRMNIKLFPTKHEEGGRKSVFENHDNELEGKLKTFSGKTISSDEFQKEFSENANSILEKSYATINGDGKVSIRKDAYNIEKTFSKIIISVTKTLELDPTIMSGSRPIGDVVGGLPLPEKSIMVLKKAHNLPDGPEEIKDKDGWIRDSQICEDLKEEYSDETLGLEDFIKLIRERYPDAPKDIYDELERRGVISLRGTKVNIR